MGTSDRRTRLRDRLFEQDGVDPDDVIMSPSRAREHGPDQHRHVPPRQPRPEGSVIKSTAIDPTVVDPDGVYRKTGPARVFTRERDAIAAIKGQGETADQARRRPGPDRPRPDGRGDGGDLPDHRGAASISRSASRWPC